MAKGMARPNVISYNTNGSENWKWNKEETWNSGNKKGEVQTCGWKQVCKK